MGQGVRRPWATFASFQLHSWISTFSYSCQKLEFIFTYLAIKLLSTQARSFSSCDLSLQFAFHRSWGEMTFISRLQSLISLHLPEQVLVLFFSFPDSLKGLANEGCFWYGVLGAEGCKRPETLVKWFLVMEKPGCSTLKQRQSFIKQIQFWERCKGRMALIGPCTARGRWQKLAGEISCISS